MENHMLPENFSLKTEAAGNYTCTVINTARPGYPNITSFVSVHFLNSEEKYSGCNRCAYIETCQESNEKTFCVSIFWVHIAVVFILLSAAFAIASIVMIMQREKNTRKHFNQQYINWKQVCYLIVFSLLHYFMYLANVILLSLFRIKSRKLPMCSYIIPVKLMSLLMYNTGSSRAVSS